MKEYIEYIEESLFDFEGKNHPFILVAISSELPKTLKNYGKTFLDMSEDTPIYYEVCSYIEDYGTDEYSSDLKKVLRIGLAICNPVDKFDRDKGIAKATARARKSEPVIWTNKPGIINTKMVKALLEQEAKYIKDNPAIVIKGYSEREQKFLYDQNMKKLETNFDDSDKAIVSKALNNSKYLNTLSEYINWFKKAIKKQ